VAPWISVAKKQTAERTRGSNAALKDDYELNGVMDAAVSLHGRPVGRHKLDGEVRHADEKEATKEWANQMSTKTHARR
jgi:hypothetical protein